LRSLLPLRIARLGILAGCLPAALATAAEQPTGKFGFKGLELGSGIAAVAGNPRYACHAGSSPGADTVCGLRAREKETIAGAPVRTLFLFYYGGRLTSIAIHLEERHFAQVSEALHAKYGDTPARTESIRNLNGMAFENRTYTWKAPGETLVAQRYAGRVDQSAIRFTADALIQQIEQRRAAVAKDPRKDL
jgi:hypothetical protein